MEEGLPQASLVIMLRPDGQGVAVNGPILATPVLAFGALALAHDALQEFYQKQRDNPSSLQIAQALPPTPITGRKRK